MKKLFTLLTALFVVFSINAQTVDSVDYAMLKFVSDAYMTNDLDEIVLDMDDNLNPYVVLANYGPSIPSESDNVKIYITLGDQPLGSLTLPSSYLAVGQAKVIYSQQPIRTAAQMNAAGFAAGDTRTLCYNITIEGEAIDPDETNNEVCIPVRRVDDPSGIAENAISNLSIYPNPATSTLNVSNAEGSQISLFDFSGRRIQQVDNASANHTFDVSGLATGIYMLRIEHGASVVSKKVSIVR